MKIKLLLASLILGTLAFAFAAPLHAQAISGSIVFQGSATASGDSSLSSPTTIDFGNNWVFTGGTGDYSAILIFTGATFNDFTFMGDGANAMLTGPVDPLWSISYNGINYSFDLNTLTNGHTESGAMAFTGLGELHETGHADTPGTFALSGTGSNFHFTFDNEQNTAVPEPSALIGLIAGGVILIGVQRMRRSRA